MDAHKIIRIMNKLLNSKNDKINYRSRNIAKVVIYYEDDIILTLRDGNGNQIVSNDIEEIL